MPRKQASSTTHPEAIDRVPGPPGIEGVTGRSVDCILALEDLGSTEDAVYWSGSLVEGLGNIGSDVDIYVVGRGVPKAPALMHKKNFSIAIHFVGRRRIDFEYWPWQEALGLAETLDGIAVGQEFVADSLSPVEELFVHRLSIGVPLLSNPAWTELRSRFDFVRFRGYLTQQAIHRIDGAVEDVVGMLDDADLECAVYRARDLVGLAFDAFANHEGVPSLLPKWRPKLVDRLPPSALSSLVGREFRALSLPGPGVAGDRKDTERYVMRCMSLAETVTAWIQG